MQFLHKIKSKFLNSPEVRAPPLAVLTQVTALAILSGTSLKWYGKLLVCKCNKYPSELILFPYRRSFHTAALPGWSHFFLQTFQLHLKQPRCMQCVFQAKRNMNHHKQLA